jgi:hypothetical protein
MSQSERDERIAVLERRLQRRTSVGVSAPVAVLAMALALAALWIFERKDWAYYVSPSEPVWVGREGEYRWDLLRSNRFVEIHGTPTTRGLYGQGSVVVGLRDTPVLVRRRALPGEEWAPGTPKKPPQPNQTPFAVSGRLLSIDDAPAWAREAADQLRQGDEVRPVDGKTWILLAGERPRSDRSLLLITALLLTFTALNGYFLVKGLRRE